ncbi:lipoprotein-releasing ABC transporter ATP-binding protein LolD [Francisella philomiragia]|uniref:Lipoprotein-releasing system ATP-binding protein LolD n=1 Tax=Francisella philomiragia subsp. philomiragia (strain ATCC 25017 / CCUG 19701 / FSC 153 / O\|nr:lipoprotein-releasing ABC transporter ATP-binding protein LolD [Francisella philomiragia]AJI46638.1 liporeleasing system, ATP-binding protein [Francisella philomiragia]AJI48367.1 liporeleasing system, ATP-binding protein [Francisella philomiragia]MBK2021080.1 lipoprotein-releasing ABC transporter ATP-binding protein LolD [Francisella philomiragia]MBK2031061.1 lipoprotein-releasing ABC transporter ATP-binding protein LolD [Francisella philomiragia]MBK2264192.1 lipoprotein-releasing ABC trans
MSNIVLSCKNVSKSYTEFKTDIAILKNVNLEINKGEKVAILGLSGSGKTTLLNVLGGLDKCSSGEVMLMGERFDNQSVNKRAKMRNKHLGFIYQLHHLLPEFTAIENVMIPLAITKKYTKKESIKLANEILTKVGLEHRAHHKPAELSGGERQRVAIARALVTNPNCILADEPTGNLDSQRSESIFALMQQLSDDFGTSFVIVTHDEKLASRMNKIYRLVDGELELVEQAN